MCIFFFFFGFLHDSPVVCYVDISLICMCQYTFKTKETTATILNFATHLTIISLEGTSGWHKGHSAYFWDVINEILKIKTNILELQSPCVAWSACFEVLDSWKFVSRLFINGILVDSLKNCPWFVINTPSLCRPGTYNVK